MDIFIGLLTGQWVEKRELNANDNILTENNAADGHIKTCMKNERKDKMKKTDNKHHF